MGLFFEVLSAINNPEQQASMDQLKNIAESVQSVSKQNGLDTSTTQTMLSALGEQLRPALQQQAQAVGGSDQLGGLISQLAGTGSPDNSSLGGMLNQLGGAAGLSALQSLIPEQLQQQIIQNVAQKTGLNPNMIQSMIPTLLPAILGMFQMGASKAGTSASGGNTILNAFLDSDRDGDVDLGDLLNFANRFLGSSR